MVLAFNPLKLGLSVLLNTSYIDKNMNYIYVYIFKYLDSQKNKKGFSGRTTKRGGGVTPWTTKQLQI